MTIKEDLHALIEDVDENARRELWAQRDFIAQERPAVAARIVRDVLAAIARLTAYPYYGRAAPWDRTHQVRELPVPNTPLVVL